MTLREKVLHHRFRAEEPALECRAQDIIPVIFGELVDLAHHADADVVEQDVDPAEDRQRFGDHAIHLHRAARIGDDRDARPAQSRDARGRRRCRVRGDVDARDRGTLARERRRARRADSRARTRHQRDLTGESQARTKR